MPGQLAPGQPSLAPTTSSDPTTSFDLTTWPNSSLTVSPVLQSALTPQAASPQPTTCSGPTTTRACCIAVLYVARKFYVHLMVSKQVTTRLSMLHHQCVCGRYKSCQREGYKLQSTMSFEQSLVLDCTCAKK